MCLQMLLHSANSTIDMKSLYSEKLPFSGTTVLAGRKAMFRFAVIYVHPYISSISHCTISYRPVLSSERAPYRENNKAIVTKERIRIKSGHGPQRGARYQDCWP
jgi:hypothetical protein